MLYPIKNKKKKEESNMQKVEFPKEEIERIVKKELYTMGKSVDNGRSKEKHLFIRDKMSIPEVIDALNEQIYAGINGITADCDDDTPEEEYEWVYWPCIRECIEYIRRKEFQILFEIPDFQYKMFWREILTYPFYDADEYKKMMEEWYIEEKNFKYFNCDDKTRRFATALYLNPKIIQLENGKEIFNTLAHVVIHSLLGKEEKHSPNFIIAANHINKKLGTHITVNE